MHIIHIDWSGPHSVAEMQQAFHSDTCFGLYQVYGPHPVYGSQQLLYIGKASDRTFSTRLPEHGWIHGTRDSSQVSIYLGRLCGNATPDNDTWSREIDFAERLLIYAHFPPYNSQKWVVGNDPAIREVHVLNWKQHRDLLPEVSGLRWFEANDDPASYHPYSNTESGKQPSQSTVPTSMSATPAADAPIAPATGAAHL